MTAISGWCRYAVVRHECPKRPPPGDFIGGSQKTIFLLPSMSQAIIHRESTLGPEAVPSCAQAYVPPPRQMPGRERRLVADCKRCGKGSICMHGARKWRWRVGRSHGGPRVGARVCVVWALALVSRPPHPDVRHLEGQGPLPSLLHPQTTHHLDSGLVMRPDEIASLPSEYG